MTLVVWWSWTDIEYYNTYTCLVYDMANCKQFHDKCMKIGEKSIFCRRETINSFDSSSWNIMGAKFIEGSINRFENQPHMIGSPKNSKKNFHLFMHSEWKSNLTLPMLWKRSLTIFMKEKKNKRKQYAQSKKRKTHSVSFEKQQFSFKAIEHSPRLFHIQSIEHFRFIIAINSVYSYHACI